MRGMIMNVPGFLQIKTSTYVLVQFRKNSICNMSSSNIPFFNIYVSTQYVGYDHFSTSAFVSYVIN